MLARTHADHRVGGWVLVRSSVPGSTPALPALTCHLSLTLPPTRAWGEVNALNLPPLQAYACFYPSG